ncbi:VanZ-like protein [Kalmanozyma brasiliensis GHG001]|uniref:VanZ-like domain-containing protein n=1 Tax=Kalmanozyma brasiliensis (strain GHG001) TaxID=1365824 RepID=V5ETV8_KALBG|nr:VanZ-like protein [Kalmanozyma brasiliensis GHG001]EST05494.1 VanZ-like protein [Kalmanozyma brasiliensis GHG001]
MPRLETSSGWSRFTADVTSLFHPSTGTLSQRLTILRSLLLRSVRLSPPSSSTSGPALPLRIRPAFVLLNILDLLLLGILGFHPRSSTWLRLNDKLLHFICFLLATSMFYMIWDVDEPARASYLWRNASLFLTGITCFVVGGVGSEIVQSALPYKVFQWGDIVANLLGSSLGLWLSYHAEKRYRARREIERLYEPLDVEYGDAELDEEEEEGPRGILREGGATSQGAGKKKARFSDNDIWDDSVDIGAMPSTSQRSGAADPGAKVRREDLFSIDDDDEEDDGPASRSNGKPQAEEANVWKQTDA